MTLKTCFTLGLEFCICYRGFAAGPHFYLTFKSDTGPGQHSQFVLCLTYKLSSGIFSPIFLFHLLTRKSPFGQHFLFPPDKFCHQLHLPSRSIIELSHYLLARILFASWYYLHSRSIIELSHYSQRMISLKKCSKDDFPQKILKAWFPSKNAQRMIFLKKCSPQKMLKGWLPSGGEFHHGATAERAAGLSLFPLAKYWEQISRSTS